MVESGIHRFTLAQRGSTPFATAIAFLLILCVWGVPSAAVNWNLIGDGYLPNLSDANQQGDSSAPSITVDLDGNLVVAWQQGLMGIRRIMVSRWTGGEWQELGSSQGSKAPSQDGQSEYLPSISMGLHGDIWLTGQSHQEDGSSVVFIRKYDGDQWHTLAGSSPGGGITETRGATGLSACLVDDQESPILMWNEGLGLSINANVARLSTSTWTLIGGRPIEGWECYEMLSGGSNRGRVPILICGKYSFGQDQELLVQYDVMSRSGENWSSLSRSMNTPLFTRLAPRASRNKPTACISDDSLYVAWLERDGEGSDRWSVNILRYHNGMWEPLGPRAQIYCGRGIGHEIALAAADGELYVAWFEEVESRGSYSQLIVRCFDGDEWSDVSGGFDEGILTQRGLSTYPLLALNEGSVYLVWQQLFEEGWRIRVARGSSKE